MAHPKLKLSKINGRRAPTYILDAEENIYEKDPSRLLLIGDCITDFAARIFSTRVLRGGLGWLGAAVVGWMAAVALHHWTGLSS